MPIFPPSASAYLRISGAHDQNMNISRQTGSILFIYLPDSRKDLFSTHYFPDLREGFRFAVSAPYFRRNTDAIAVNVEDSRKSENAPLRVHTG